MSTSDKIKEMTKTFVESKSKKNLADLSLEDMAQAWSKAKGNSDFEQQSENISKVVNDETLQNKISEYLVSLHYGRFSPADFPHIAEFCEEFGYKMNNPELKNKIQNLKETMESCRLSMPKEVKANVDDKLKAEFPLPQLNQIVISGDNEIIKDMPDKKLIAGKTFTFMDDKGKTIGGVEYDEHQSAHILSTDKDGNAVEYELTPDQKFYRINEDGSVALLDMKDSQGKSWQDIRAYNLAGSAIKTWKKYINKELDKNIVKAPTRELTNQQTTVNEGVANALKINEGEKAATKVNEGLEETTLPPTTKFNEQESAPEKKESEINNDSANNFAPKPDELYWKEDDIIKVMFQDWFLAFANAATNWAIHQVEYAAAGVWDTIQKSYRNRATSSNDKKEATPDVTHQFYNGIENLSKKQMASFEQSANTQSLIEQLKNGQPQDIVIQNDLLRNFAQQTGIDVAGLLSQGNPEKTVPILTSMASLYAKYTDTYARASLLDGKMNDKHNYDNIKQEDLYQQKNQEGGKILSQILYDEIQKNPQNADFKVYINTIQKAAQDMDKALEIGLKDYQKGRYDENGKKPKENPILASYQSKLHQKDEPMDLHEFGKQQIAILNSRDYILSGLNTETAELDAAQHENQLKRQNLLKSKDFILKGLDPEKNMINITESKKENITIPLKPRGQERD